MAKILIVDDSRTSRKILRNLLEEQGYEVKEAANGAEGVRLYKEEKADVVTMDITMPVMDGLEALEEIRSFDSDARVIMVTAAGQESKIVKAVKLGAAEFLTKPFDKDKILKIVESVLSN